MDKVTLDEVFAYMRAGAQHAHYMQQQDPGNTESWRYYQGEQDALVTLALALQGEIARRNREGR